MAKSEAKRMAELYEEQYGNLPDNREELCQYIYDHYNISEDAFSQEQNRIHHIPWRSVEFTINAVPKPTPRPRWSSRTNRFYVKGASSNKKFMENLIHQFEIICTRTEIIIEVYQPTPISVMKKHEILLAEAGLLRPLMTSDWDNLGKSYSDMIQDVLIINDCIITSARVEKYYSIKPRARIIINWQNDYDSDFNRKKMQTTSWYQSLESEGRCANDSLEYDKEIYDRDIVVKARPRKAPKKK